MSDDEKRARKAVTRAFWLMSVPLILALAFICVRASSNGRWLYYSMFFLIFLSRRIFIILLRIMSRLELELRNNAENDPTRLSYFCAVIYNLVIELMILGFLNLLLLYLKKPLFGWDCFVFLIPIVLLQVGIRCFQQATECLYHVRRLHHATYNRDNRIVYGSTFAGLVKASTYSIPYGKDYQEVGIVLIEKREKERYKSEEDYLSSGASDFLFLPVFLIKSSCEAQPPVIQYDREQKGPLTLQFPDGGAILMKHYSVNRSFNRLVYFFKFRKFLQLPSGYRKRLLPGLTFSGLRPVLVPKKNHSMRLFLVVCLAVLCAVWTTGCAATIFTGALLVDRIDLATLKTSLDGTVVDETGTPMKDVKLVARFSYPTWDYMRTKTKTERQTIDGKFDIWKLGYNDVDLSFYKVGYEAEDYHLHGGFGLVENEENTLKQHNMRVVMRRIHPPAHPPIRLRTLQHLYEATDLRYDMKRKERRVLAFRSSKPVMPEYTFVPFGQKPDESQYLELDFLRDEQGGIVTREFPGAVDSRGETVKYPAIFLIRLHSDDPDDGFVLFEEGKSLAEQNHFDGTIRKWHDYSGEMREVHALHTQIIRDCSAAQRRMQDHFMELAPEDGYTRREIAIPIEEIVRIWDYGQKIETTWYSPYRFAFLRVGGRYAKILFMFGGTIDSRAKEVDSGELGDDFRASIYYNVFLNPEKGDRELKEFY